jgi:hypothetical protein
VTVCRPVDATKNEGRARYTPAADLNDAFRRTKSGQKEYVHANAARGLGIVLWHGCEIDAYVRRGKPQKAVVGVAPIFRMVDAVHQSDARQAIRSLQRRALFPLQAFSVEGRQLDEGYVDFRYIWSVKQSIVTDRLATLGETALRALYGHLFVFLTRHRSDGGSLCPSCNQVVPLDA